MDLKKMEEGFRLILEGMGENIQREGLIDTPKRVARMYAELMTGLSGELKEEDILKTQFHEKYDEMVYLKDIEFAYV
jgi:GTP cyclohydrolase I